MFGRCGDAPHGGNDAASRQDWSACANKRRRIPKLIGCFNVSARFCRSGNLEGQPLCHALRNCVVSVDCSLCISKTCVLQFNHLVAKCFKLLCFKEVDNCTSRIIHLNSCTAVNIAHQLIATISCELIRSNTAKLGAVHVVRSLKIILCIKDRRPVCGIICCQANLFHLFCNEIHGRLPCCDLDIRNCINATIDRSCGPVVFRHRTIECRIVFQHVRNIDKSFFGYICRIIIRPVGGEACVVFFA